MRASMHVFVVVMAIAALVRMTVSVIMMLMRVGVFFLVTSLRNADFAAVILVIGLR